MIIKFMLYHLQWKVFSRMKIEMNLPPLEGIIYAV